MLKRTTILSLIILLINLTGVAQNIPGESRPFPGAEKEYLAKLNTSSPGIQRVESLLTISDYYYYYSQEKPENLDKSISYARNAVAISKSINFPDGTNEGKVLIASAYTEINNGISDPATLDSLIDQINKVKEESKLLKQPEREIRALRQLSIVYQLAHNFSLAETTLLEMLKIFHNNGFPNTHYTYRRLGLLNRTYGNYDKALLYSLEGMKIMKVTGDSTTAGHFYNDLGYMYRAIGQHQKGIDYFEDSFNFFKNYKSCYLYELKDAIAEAMSKMGRIEEAIVVLNEMLKEYPTTNSYNLRVMEGAIGRNYRMLKQYELAEPHFKKMFELMKVERTMDPWVYKMLGQFYAEWGKFEEAEPYLEVALKLLRPHSHLHFLMYMVDSAQGNYPSAMKHLMQTKILDDERYHETKTRAIQELTVKYETEIKDQELKIKEQNILLLKRQSELQEKSLEQAAAKHQFDVQSREQSIQIIQAEAEKKDKDLLVKQQNIELLKRESQLQQSQFQQARITRNMFLGGAIMLLLLLALGYNRYRLKQRANNEMNKKNLVLQHLIEEKEWLLKEVHHRVKNNLQTVLSLLESQSRYLNNDALHAIQNSQNRVYAMSLIHKKLYHTSDVATINMEDYLRELVNHLRDSFGSEHRVKFNLNFKSIELDVSQAVPIGLIVNEAITNSIKYAFPEMHQDNQITVSFRESESKEVELLIADNGIGLIEFSNTRESSGSLGLKLIKGLTEDIGGRFSMKSESGFEIFIRFVANIPLHKLNGTPLPQLITQEV